MLIQIGTIKNYFTYLLYNTFLKYSTTLIMIIYLFILIIINGYQLAYGFFLTSVLKPTDNIYLSLIFLFQG